MRRPGPPLIFLATFLAMLVMVFMVTSVSAVSAPGTSKAAFLPEPVPKRTAVPDAVKTQAPAKKTQKAKATPTPKNTAVKVVEPQFDQPTAALDDLEAFARSVADGQAGVVRGVFAPGLFAYPVTMQPADDANWVSNQANEVTLFSAAAEYGVLALLAHNTLAGYVFDGLKTGDEVVLVYGDGTTENYRITGAQSFQALQPQSPVSDFVDLASGQTMSSGEVFSRIYTGEYPLVLQTCIEKDGNTKWGRLFLTGVKE